MRESFNVATILPFWRYAVCPSHNGVPGVPFYTLKEAEQFFVETTATLPWFDCFLIKRGWNGVVLVKHYKGVEFSLPFAL